MASQLAMLLYLRHLSIVDLTIKDSPFRCHDNNHTTATLFSEIETVPQTKPVTKGGTVRTVP